MEIVQGEGIRSAQLGKSSLLKNRACWIHLLEFRCTELGERLQEEKQPGAPCHVSSDDVWRVAVNSYAKLKHHKFAKYTSATTVRLFLLAYYRMAGNELMSGSTGSAGCYVRPSLMLVSRLSYGQLPEQV